MPSQKTDAKFQNQSQMLANKVLKRYRHLRKRFARQGIEVFRLYDWDIPEIRAVVDWYAGHLVIGEYTRNQSVDEWLPLMGRAVAAALEVAPENLHLKKRYYGPSDGKRYERIDTTDQMITVIERDLTFLVNPYDYVDTGLFSDHRNTRQMFRQEAVDKDVLNLYCYTGTFTCAAAKGGAHSTVSVDRSKTAIAWARRNLALNGISEPSNTLIQYHVMDYLAIMAQRSQKFDLVIVDPPSFSTRRSKEDHFDILTDHPALLSAVKQVVRPGGVIYFSTNHQQFTPDPDLLGGPSAKEITDQTIPEDYRNKRKTIHRCWKIRV
jgi:23S rRNA (cytosine1962-C5)-methyltransferase